MEAPSDGPQEKRGLDRVSRQTQRCDGIMEVPGISRVFHGFSATQMGFPGFSEGLGMTLEAFVSGLHRYSRNDGSRGSGRVWEAREVPGTM